MKTLLAIVSLLISTSAIAKDDPVIAHGEKLHNEKCISCHNTEVYIRENRRVKSLQGLSDQVSFCMKGAAKANWSTSDTNSVVEFLNTRYYKF